MEIFCLFPDDVCIFPVSRSEIYCRFVLENPRDVDSAVDLELEDLITAATAVVHMVAILLLYVPNVITWVQ